MMTKIQPRHHPTRSDRIAQVDDQFIRVGIDFRKVRRKNIGITPVVLNGTLSVLSGDILQRKWMEFRFATECGYPLRLLVD